VKLSMLMFRLIMIVLPETIEHHDVPSLERAYS